MTLKSLSEFMWPMRAHLLNQVEQQRTDYLRHLNDKDAEIRRLRADLGSRSVRMDSVQDNPRDVPHGTHVEFPEPAGPLDWQHELNKMLDDIGETEDVQSG